jgi:hypothetical protein
MERRYFLFLIVILSGMILAMSYDIIPRVITGLGAGNDISVSIKSKLAGKIKLGYEPYINYSQEQVINAEFMNTGTETLTEQLEVKIYTLNNSRLQLLASYYDTFATLRPGMSKSLRIVFVPPDLGVYYIKARASYDGRMTETWGSFMVVYYPPPQEIIPGPVTIVYPPEAPKAGVANMSLQYSDKAELGQGQSTLLGVIVKNTGDVKLHNLKFTISTTSLIGTDINPKQVFELSPKESVVFVITVDVPETVPPGLYPIDFEVVADELKRSGIITLNVTPVVVPVLEDLYRIILNYQFLISEIEQEIYNASLKGFNVTLPSESLDNAKVSLNIAKQYYYSGRYEDAKNKLNDVKRHIEDAVFRLAIINIPVFKFPAYVPVLLILIAVLLVLLTVLGYLLKKRGEEELKRPRLLRGREETE